ncbi:hypothetical protein DL763_009349 [Monosporascus cannonballus]|nr:hypothetical protein DL763_009349 [Monosporascus cannonballus]
MTRTSQDKENLRDAAQKEVNARGDIKLDEDETTGEDDFKYRQHPDVVGVVVDKGSGRGFVQISGQVEGDTVRISTGRGRIGYEYRDILEGQSCMLYGCPTVFFILRASS